jgi:plastocyanin
MNQKNTIVLVVVLFAAAAFIGGYLWRGSVETSPEPAVSASVTPVISVAVAQTPPLTTTPKPRMHTVTYTATGVSPKSLSIQAGDAVQFRNSSTTEVWPASDPHPSHSNCAGFDAGRALRMGEEYTLTFPVAKTCTYHSHVDPLNSAVQGTIIVR